MKRFAWRRGVVAGMLATVGLGCQQSIDEVHAVDETGRLTIDMPRGDVSVRRHDLNEVRIVGRAEGLNAWAFGFEATREDEEIEIEGDLSVFRIRLIDGLDVALEVLVPERFDVEVDVGRGPIRIEGVEGRLRLENRDGDIVVAGGGAGGVRADSRRGSIRLADIDGDVTATTRHGSIEAAGIGGDVEAVTRHGAIELAGVGGAVRADSRSGAVRVRDVLGPVDVTTRRGEIELFDLVAPVEARARRGRIMAGFARAAEASFEIHDGAIELRLPKDAGFDLSAESERGEIRLASEFGGGELTSGELERSIAGGGPSIEAAVRSGRIDVVPIGPPSVALAPAQLEADD